MKVFRLAPVEGTQGSHHWQASTLAPTTVWVRADDEEDARQMLTLATIVATRIEPGREMAMAPWKNFGLVSCVADNSHDVVAGIVLTVSGDTLEIPKS